MKNKKYLSLDSKDLSQRELYTYMISAVAPRPIALASTIDSEGNVNLSPFSFFNVFSSDPPIMIFSPVRRGSDGTSKDTLDNVLQVKEVVINIVNYPIVEQMSLASTGYDKGVNEFEKSGLTQLASDLIAPPRVAESPVSFECTIDDVIALGSQGGSGNLVISRVVKTHIDTSVLDSDDNIDTTKMDLVARMGGMWYAKASGDALFQIPKPLSTKGIGVDALPDHVRKSDVLTGNDLGRLGNVEQVPSAHAIEKAKLIISSLNQLNLAALHKRAQMLIHENKTFEALTLLYAYSD